VSKEAFHHDGSAEVGVLLCHGFTGSPISMRPWADHLVEQGWSVRLPLLPGHGTHWRDANRTTWHDWYAEVERAYDELQARCDKVFAAGLSMGATLVLRLAQQKGEDLSGVVVVNPTVTMPRRDAMLLPVAGRILSNFPAIGNDIRKPGVTEGAYERTPLKAALSLKQLQRAVRTDLAEVTQPLLLLHSADDHVVPPVNSAIVYAGIGSADKREVVLTDSYHVATLDHDAERIFDESDEFIRAHI
jgi:carboxylesterase